MELHPVEILNVASNQSPLVSGNEQALPATAFGGPAWEFGVGFSYAGVEGALAGLATSPSGKRPALWEAIAQGARRLYAPLRVALEGGVAFFEDLPSRLSGQLVPELPEPVPLRVRGAVGAERTRRGPGVPRLSRLLVPLSEGGDVVLVMTVGRSGERAVTIQVETRDQRTGKPIASAFSMVDSESRRPVAQAERKSEAAAIFRGVAPGTALLVLETASGRWEVRLDLELKET